MNTVKKRILLVDDEEALIFGFAKYLKSDDMDIDTAQTLKEARNLIQTNKYNIIVADLRLGNSIMMEGLEIIRFTKEKLPSCLLIVLTAYGEKDTKEKVHALGADFYFEKPVSPKNIKEVIDTIK
jgi:DNA-binding response OmpR family regulator